MYKTWAEMFAVANTLPEYLPVLDVSDTDATLMLDDGNGPEEVAIVTPEGVAFNKDLLQDMNGFEDGGEADAKKPVGEHTLEFSKGLPRPKKRGWHIELRYTKDKSIALVAVWNDTGDRVKDGWLIKVRPDGYVYRYHTINPVLGFTVTNEGRLPLLKWDTIF